MSQAHSIAVEFSAPFSPGRIARHEVHLWRASLDMPLEKIAELEPLLSPEERRRAARFRFEKDRAQSIVSRGILRTILAGYLKKPPEQIAIVAGKNGKPRLADAEKSGLNFNVSHSRALALVAITPQRDIGIDVEFIDPDFPCLEAAPGFCTPGELARLRALAPENLRELFFKIWTAKEARLKASGDGFFVEATELKTRIEENHVLEIFSPLDVAPWPLQSFSLDENFVAAVVTKNPCGEMRFFHFETPLMQSPVD